MPPESPTARELAHRLLARELAGRRDTPDVVAAAAQRVCQHVSSELSRWVGPEGARVLLARALALAQVEHPVLANVQSRTQSEACMTGLVESARAYGAAATAEGMVAILAALIELLGRLIGDDMAMSLVEESIPARASDAAGPNGGATA